MTSRHTILVIALFVTAVAGARAQSPEQRQAEAQLANPTLTNAVVPQLDLRETPVSEIVATIAKAGGITVRYHSAVTNLDTPVTAKMSNAMMEDALHTVIDSRGLTFKVTGRTSVFVYPNTPANREKYTESRRTFAVAKADVRMLMQILNQSLTFGADDLRPTIVMETETRTITARATPDMMAKIAKVIAENDR